MMLLALAALAAAAPPPPTAARAEPQRQARASVTILAAEPLRFAEIERTRPAILRDSQVVDADGNASPIRLVEFE